MRIIYVTTIGATLDFFTNIIKELICDGNIVDIATNEMESKVSNSLRELGCNIYQISCKRSPFDKGNVTAIREIQKIVTTNHYDIVHCHTPIAAMCTRMACNSSRKQGTKVIYTAHGFHFYKGAPFINWLLFYPIEKICSYMTDVLITINEEDYKLALKRMRANRVVYVPGVGIDIKKYTDTVIDISQKREEIGVPQNAYLLLSVGELNNNKNHQIIIKTIANIEDDNIHYAIAGKGKLYDDLKKLADELGVGDRLHLLGYRSDVNELFKASDLFVLPSIREGLNVSVMEAMASGLPCAVSKIRGNVDMVCDENCFNPFSVDEIKNVIQKHPTNRNDFIKNVDFSSINKKIKEIYITAQKN